MAVHVPIAFALSWKELEYSKLLYIAMCLGTHAFLVGIYKVCYQRRKLD